MSGDPIPAVAEDEAAGDTARIYAEIRAAPGVALVNLVWRHLAALEGGLAWAWGALRPLYVDGTLATRAEAFTGALDLPRLPGVPPDVLRAARVDEAGEAGVAATLAAYARANAMNLLGLRALLAAADGVATPADGAAGVSPGDPPPPTAGAPPATSLPPLPPRGTLGPDLAVLTARLDRLGDPTGDRIEASLWRHLSHWPGWLALAWARLEPAAADGRLDEATLRVERGARAQIRGLAARVDGAAARAAPPGVRAALEDFLRRVRLPRMIALTALLEAEPARDPAPARAEPRAAAPDPEPPYPFEAGAAARVRDACIEAALAGYEAAGMSGLCAEGRFEAAVSAMRMLDPRRALAKRGAGD